MDWLKAIDPVKAVQNCMQDIFGDWYRDPWNWPELTWVGVKNASILQSRLNGNGTMRCVKIDVPKENYVTRPAVILDPIDRLAYQAMVDYLSPSIVRDLATFVYGWRLSRKEPIKGLYVHNGNEWERYRRRLEKLAFTYSHGLSTDIVSFFASVPVEDLMEEIGQLVGSSKVHDRLRDLLVSWQKVNGRSGLPQRCKASSVLAHVYLRPIDDLLARRTKMRRRKSVERYRSCRWMDDIWVFSNKESELRSIQCELQQALSQRRLNLNVAKTKVAMGPALEEAVLDFEHSAVDKELREEGTSEELDKLSFLWIGAALSQLATPSAELEYVSDRDCGFK